MGFILAAPSPELVKRVRELHQRNSSDVRFLIPVLHGLQKVSHVTCLKSHVTCIIVRSDSCSTSVYQTQSKCYEGSF